MGLMKQQAEAEKRLAVAEALRGADSKTRELVAKAEQAARAEGAAALRQATDEVMRECMAAAEEEKRKVRHDMGVPFHAPPPLFFQSSFVCAWCGTLFCVCFIQAVSLWTAQQEAVLVEARASQQLELREAVRKAQHDAAERLRDAVARERARAKVWRGRVFMSRCCVGVWVGAGAGCGCGGV